MPNHTRGKLTARIRKAPSARPRLEALEARELLASVIALTTGNELLRFDSADPGKLLRDSPITGIVPGDTLESLAIRPQTGQLFGVGSDSRFYGLSTRSASATQVGPQFPSLLTGNAGNLVINPVSDQGSVVTNSGQDFQINPSTGITTQLAALPPQVRVAGIAYTNNNPGATSTQLYGIDYVANRLLAMPDPSNPGGAPTIVGPLGVNILSPQLGFAITPDGTALAALHDNDGYNLYQIDLTTGAATFIGPIGDGTRTILSLAVERPATAYGLSNTGSLVSFVTDTPQDITTLAPSITGLRPGDSIANLSFDPISGNLFGVGTSASLYSININPATGAVGAATPIGNAPAQGLSGSAAGTFDPIHGTYRVITSAGQNIKILPSSGVEFGATGLAYAFGDQSGLFAPNIQGLASDNPLNGAGSSTLYGVDSSRNTLVTLGSVADDAGNNRVGADTGQVFTVGGLGVVIEDNNVGFAINTKNDSFAVLTTNVNGVVAPRLYRINLSTGKAAFAGNIGNNTEITTLALAQPGVIRFAPIAPVSEPAVGGGPATATITVTRSFGDTINTADIKFSTGPGGSAVAGVNFVPTSKILTFGVGEFSKTVTVPILNDGVATGPLVANVSLSRLPGSLTRLGGTLTNGSVVAPLVINNTGGTTVVVGGGGGGGGGEGGGTIALAQASDSVKETAGLASFTIVRTGSTAGTATVTYTVAGDTAVSGTDFLPPAATSVTFAPGETSKVVTFQVLDNVLDNANKTVKITLSGPTGGAVLGAQASESIKIVSQPSVDTIQFNVNRGRATSLTIQFGNVVNAAAARSIKSYELKVGSKTIVLLSAHYDAAKNQVVLKTRTPLPANKTLHLTIHGSAAGGPIAGPDFVQSIGYGHKLKLSTTALAAPGQHGDGHVTAASKTKGVAGPVGLFRRPGHFHSPLAHTRHVRNMGG